MLTMIHYKSIIQGVNKIHTQYVERSKHMSVSNSLNTELLKQAVETSGITVTRLAVEVGITRESLYNKLRKDTEFTASEIIAVSRALKLTNEQRDHIFFGQ